MSSWIIARNVAPRKKTVTISKYFDASNTSDMPELYLNYLSAYIYSQKMGEPCIIWDPRSILQDTLRPHPQVRYLKDVSEEQSAMSLDVFKTIVSSVKFKDVQKIAADLIFYDQAFNREVVNVIQKAGIKTTFDIGIYLTSEMSEPNLTALKMYSEIIKTFQKKSKKITLSVYIMTDNYNVFTQFQSYCDPSWAVASLSKSPAIGATNQFIHLMANIQIMSTLPALALDFSRSVDRFIYLMQRHRGGLTYFTEINGLEWNLI
jgi:hypothetical protein